MASNSLRSEVLQSFKNLHRTSTLVFKNDKTALNKVRKEINDNYKKNKNVLDSDSIRELIRYAYNVADEIKCTVAEVEETRPGVYRLKLRPEMFEKSNSAPAREDRSL